MSIRALLVGLLLAIGGPVTAQEATTGTAAPDAAPEEPVPGLGIDIRYGDIRVTPKVFGDVGFGFVDPADAAGFGRSSFFLGELDLFVTASFGERWQALGETVIESRPSEDGEEFDVGVERLWVQYEAAPWLRLKLGREHDPVTYWNRRFHHGAWVQTSLSRPRIVQFEEDDGLLPIDVTGLELNGRLD